MCKTEMFNKILSVVAEETEIPAECILSRCKRREIVDARYILVRMMHRSGYYTPTIATYLNVSRRAVEKMVELFDERQKQNGRMFTLSIERVANKLRNSCETID